MIYMIFEQVKQEALVFLAMAKAAQQKSVVFISHRLSTTRNADRIVMLEQGRIIEEGNHEDLLQKKGKYAEMWRAQASKYVDV
jgi:ATP-binding cassette subfamily B protein